MRNQYGIEADRDQDIFNVQQGADQFAATQARQAAHERELAEDFALFAAAGLAGSLIGRRLFGGKAQPAPSEVAVTTITAETDRAIRAWAAQRGYRFDTSGIPMSIVAEHNAAQGAS